jgi:hypothetical protein
MGWEMESPTNDDMAGWPHPNYVNPHSREWLIIGIEAPLTLIAVLFVGARFYSRTCVKYVLGWDDWVMLAAMVDISLTP